MRAAAPPHLLALPRSWPRRVRSAAVNAISLADFALTSALSWAAQSLNPRLRLRAELERARQEISLLREEIRIKDARMQHLEAQKRPHYPPTERLAILELRAARHWSLAQTARTFLVTPLTIASWTGRLDEAGPDALVRLPEPVNRFPVFVGYLVRRLRTLCPTLGKVKIAQILARAGLHLAPTTVRRMMKDQRPSRPPVAEGTASLSITARKPNDLWHVDLTTVPIALGFWIPWLPSLFLKPGPSAGGSQLRLTTARGASWGSRSSAASPSRLPFAASLSASSTEWASGPDISSPTRVGSSSPGSSSAGADAAASGSASVRWASTAAWR